MNNKFNAIGCVLTSFTLLLCSTATAAPLFIASETDQQSVNQVIFIDKSIDDYQHLAKDIIDSKQANKATIVDLSPDKDAIKQISQALKQYKQLDAIHLFTHGFPGGVKVGNQIIDASEIKENEELFSDWHEALNEYGDLLLYGCEVAQDSKGNEFIKALSNATQLDIAASSNTTGNPAKNQDWLLEKTIGKIETASLIRNDHHNRFKATLDITNQNAFLYGNNIEVGIGPDGSFGSDIVSPEGKFQGRTLGYISDPSAGSFATSYHGDFFMPGSPEEGWGIRVNGQNFNNNNNIQGGQILGSFSDFKDTPTSQSVVWKGAKNGLEITQVYRIYKIGISIILDVSLTNTTSVDMTDVYYLRTVDPDNNVDNEVAPTGTYDTTNKVEFQGGNSFGGASVSAAQADGSLLMLSGYGENARVSYGGHSVREPVAAYNATSGLSSSGSNTADESISIAYKFDKITAGDTVNFRTGFFLADIPKPSIEVDSDNSSGLQGGQYKNTYLLGSTAVEISDTDVNISGSAFTNISALVITIANPHEGDQLEIPTSLPSGITVNSDNTDYHSKIYVQGLAPAEVYESLLKQILFSNQDTTSSAETRLINIQVLDDNYTTSNNTISNLQITVPVTITSSPALDDNLINASEEGSIQLSGTAAPNSDVEVVFTDDAGNEVKQNITTGDDGNWTTDVSPADISGLNDGPITLEITSTDENGNEISTTDDFVKDSELAFGMASPTDGETVANSTPTLIGNSDPEATITIELANGSKVTTTADASGDWSILLAEFPLGSTQTVTATAKDNAGNTQQITRTFTIPAVPLAIDTTTLVDDNGYVDSTTPTFTGTSTPNTDITVSIPVDDTKTITCATTTDSDGKWSCTTPTLPSGGPYTATIKAEDDKGNVTTTSVDILVPELPLIIDTPKDNAVITGFAPTVSGTSNPGTTVTVTTSTGETCSAVTDATNHWACNLPNLALDQNYTLTVTANDDIGNETSETIDITTDKLPLSIIAPGDKGTAGDTTPNFVGTSMPGTTITVTASTGAQCTSVADSDGNWSCELPALPVGGPYDIVIKAEDTNGNVTTVSQSITIPETPLTITSPAENETLTGNSIVVTGTSDAETLITVLGPDGESCTTTSDTDGNWSCELFGLQPGDGKYITVISGNKAEGEEEKVSLIAVDIANSAEKVTTIVSGGGGSIPPHILLLLGLPFLKRILLCENKKRQSTQKAHG